MQILPAIDLKNGQCVRLRQGRKDEATVYASDPVEMALRWESLGAEWIHLVDLDGAFAGKPVHAEVIARIARAVAVPVEVGGGLRTDDDVREILDAGAARAILGTRAVADLDAVRRLVDRHGPAIAVGIDARGGFVQVKGWVETTSARATGLAADVARCGVATIVYTDTATDGMLKGPNLAAMAEMADAVPGVSVIASGGVSRAADVQALARLGRANLAGVIVGKALYEATATLPELIAAAQSAQP